MTVGHKFFPEKAPRKKVISNTKHFYRMLTRKMVISITFVSLTPLILISWLILEQFNLSYREKVHAHLGELVEKHRQQIDGFLNNKLNILKFFADSHSLAQLQEEPFLESSLARLQLQFGGVFEDLGARGRRRNSGGLCRPL